MSLQVDDNSTAYVDIPYTPRDWCRDLHNQLKRFNVLVIHRGAGKTIFSINELIKQASIKEGTYAYIAPFYGQAKRNVWDLLLQFIEPLSKYPGYYVNESELRVKLPNGSQIYLLGADNVNAIRGMHFDGVILDEVSEMPPDIWTVVMPATQARKAWVIFIGTPKGHNLFYDFYTQARDPARSKEWMGLLLNVEETRVYSADEIDNFRLAARSQEEFDQEYMCSFTAAVVGAYYASHIAALSSAGRITGVSYDPLKPVHTACDIGIRDAFSIWFFQKTGWNEISIFDYEEHTGLGLPQIINLLDSKNYKYGTHLAPHDMQNRDVSTGKTRLDTAYALGVRYTIVPNIKVMDGINAVRTLLPRCRFDGERCKRGLEGLNHYRAAFDPKANAQRTKPIHDWSSHPSDAFRYLAVGIDLVDDIDTGFEMMMKRQGEVDQHWDPYEINM